MTSRNDALHARERRSFKSRARLTTRCGALKKSRRKRGRPERRAAARPRRGRRRRPAAERRGRGRGGRRAPAAPPPAAAAPARAPATASAGPPPARVKPIVIVPSAMTAVLTMLNAHEFLGAGAYLTTKEAKERGARKEAELTLERRLPSGATARYQLIDNGTRLSSGDWERVVAVFAQGAAWQFKGWKREAPVDIFSRSLGVHLMYDDERPSKNVMAWNVRILKISKSKRHLDAGAPRLWRQLDGSAGAQRRTPPSSSPNRLSRTLWKARGLLNSARPRSDSNRSLTQEAPQAPGRNRRNEIAVK